MRLLAFNRNMGRWLLRNEAGDTDEPQSFTASCANCGKPLIESWLQQEKGGAHGSLHITDDLQINYEVPHRNLP